VPGYIPPSYYKNYHPQTPGDAGAVRHYASQLRKAARSLQSVSDDADSWVYFYAESWEGAWRDKFLGTWNQYITGNSQLNSSAWAQDRANFIKANPRMARLYDANAERSTGAFQQTIQACNKMADALDQYAHAIDQEVAQEWMIFLDVLVIAASIVITAVSFGALGPEAAMLDIFVVGATIGGMTSMTIDFTNQMVNNIVVNHDSWGNALGNINMTELENAYITGFIVGGVSSVVGMGLPRLFTSMGGVFKAAAGNTVLKIGIEATGFGAGTFGGDIAAQEIVSLDTRLRLAPVDWGTAGKDALFTTAGGVVLGGLMHGLGVGGRAPDTAGAADPTSQQWGIGVTTLDENGGKVSYFAISDPKGGPDVTIFEGSPTSVSREVGPGKLLDGTTLVTNDGSLSIDLTQPNTQVLVQDARTSSWISVGQDGTPVIVKEAAISDGSLKFTVVPGDRALPTDLHVDPTTGDMQVPKDWRVVSEPAAGKVTLTRPGSGDAYTFSLRDPAAQSWGGGDPRMIEAPHPRGAGGSDPSQALLVQTDAPVTIVDGTLANNTPGPPMDVATGSGGPQAALRVEPAASTSSQPVSVDSSGMSPDRFWTRGGVHQPVANQDQIVQALQQVEGLKPDVWKGLDAGQRVNVMQQVETTVAGIQGRPPMRVEPAKLDLGTVGEYDPATGTIKVNEVALNHGTLKDALGHLLVAQGDEQSILETVLHEGRHAYQHFAVATPGFEPNTDQVNSWHDNWFANGGRNYEQPSLWNPLQNHQYWTQPVETDARSFEPIAKQVLDGVGRAPVVPEQPAEHLPGIPDQPTEPPPALPDQPAEPLPNVSDQPTQHLPSISDQPTQPLPGSPDQPAQHLPGASDQTPPSPARAIPPDQLGDDPGQKLLGAGPGGSVQPHALSPEEAAQAQRIWDLRHGDIQGVTVRSEPGIDGTREGQLITLKTVQGGLGGVARNIGRAEMQLDRIGLRGVDVYVEAPNVGSAELLDFGREGVIPRIIDNGVVASIWALTRDGWVVFPGRPDVLPAMAPVPPAVDPAGGAPRGPVSRSEEVQPDASLFGRGGSSQPVPNQDQIVQALQRIEGLQPGVWKTLDPGQRVQVLQQVESTVAGIQGRPPMLVESGKLDFGTLGQYDPATGTIKVNEVALSHGTLMDAVGHLLNASGSEQSILETLLHEGRHAYQDFAIVHPGFDSNVDQVNVWRDNWAPGSYQEPSVWNPVQNYRYWAQPLEADARSFEPLAKQVLEGVGQPGHPTQPPPAPPDQPPTRLPGSPDQPAQRVALSRFVEPSGDLVPAIEVVRAQLAGPAVAASKGLLERVMEVDGALRALGTEPGARESAARALESLRTTIADAGRALDAFDARQARLQAEIELAQSLPPDQQPPQLREAQALLSNGARDAISQTLDSARGVLEAGQVRLELEPPATPVEVRAQATQAAADALRTEQVHVRERLWHEQQLQVARAEPADRELIRQQYAAAHRQLVQQQDLASVGLKILSYITEWDPYKGGVVAVNRNLCLGLADAGHDVFVRVGHEVPPGMVEGGVHVIGPRSFDAGLDERLQLLGAEGLPPSVDVVIGHSRFSGPAALQMRDERFPDARLVHVVHMVTDALGRVQGRPEFGLRNQAVEADLVAHSDLAVGVGPVLRAEVERLAAMTGSTPGFHELVPGVPFEGPVAPPPGDHHPTILLFGRADDAQKGAAAAALMVRDLPPDVTLIVRGAPPATVAEAQEELSNIAGRFVDVRPFTIDRAEILGDLTQADVVIMPSRAEGFGLVGLEAAGAGVPILVPSSSGVGRFVGDSGLFPNEVARRSLVEQGFEEPVPVERWVERLRDVLDDPLGSRQQALDLRQALREQNRTWRGAAESLVAAVRALADPPAPAAGTAPAAVEPPPDEEPRSGAAG
jgi:glycosyltransferase involved in cell wall biosynthesis